jgi:DNA-directed RNA polymerase subunit RPC12/RpoP
VNEAELLSREDPYIVCNYCKQTFRPYPGRYAPEISEVVCPYCNGKRLLYYGTDPSVVKLILSNIGINKELGERITELENKITVLTSNIDKSLIDAKNVMTTALINSVNFEIQEHEKKYHNVKPKN